VHFAWSSQEEEGEKRVQPERSQQKPVRQHYGRNGYAEEEIDCVDVVGQWDEEECGLVGLAHLQHPPQQKKELNRSHCWQC